MSTKTVKKPDHLSTIGVDKFDRPVLFIDDGTPEGQYAVEHTDDRSGAISYRRLRRGDFYLNPDGSEQVSPVSRVATIHSKPPSLGERLARYQNFDDYSRLSEQFDEEGDDDEILDRGEAMADHEDFDSPLTRYEYRMKDLVDRAKKSKKDKFDKKQAEIEEKNKQGREGLRKVVQELLAEGAIPLPPSKSNGA